MLKKIVAIVLVLLITVAAFTGCSSDAQQKTTPEKATTSTGEKTEATSLRFLDVSPSPNRQEYFEGVFEKFYQEYGIKVQYESVPWDEAASKLMVLGAAGDLPDVFTMDTIWLGQFVSAKWVLPLDNYLADTEEDYTNIVRKIWWEPQRQSYGSAYTVPDGVMVKGIYVRSDWAEEAGIELDPDKGWDYDEYFEVAQKLTDAGKGRYGVSYRGARGAFHPLMFYLENFTGGHLYAEDGTILINSEECVEAFKKWCNLYIGGYAPEDSVNWGFSEMLDGFCGGLTGTFLNDSECVISCQANMEPGTWMVMPIPRSTVDGKIYNQLNAPYSYALSSFSSNPDAAWDLIAFLNRPDNNIAYAEMAGVMPVMKEAQNSEMFSEDGPYGTFIKQINNPDLVYPCNFGPFGVSDLEQGMLHEEVQKYLLGQQDAETSLFNITSELESRMKTYLADNPGSVVETPQTLS